MTDEYWANNGVRLSMINGDRDSGERFGYAVSAADLCKREYVLSCVSQGTEESGTVVFPVWYELSDPQGAVLWTSGYLGSFDSAQKAAGATCHLARTTLFHEMGLHLDRETDLRDKDSFLMRVRQA